MVVKMLFVGSKSVSPGQTLNGTLQIVSTEDIHVTQLEVWFEGKEYASVPSEKVMHGKYFSSHYDATQKIIKSEISASRINRMIERKRNVFPMGSCEVQFSIPLPLRLPPSTAIWHDGGGCAKIEYSFKAVLRGSGNSASYDAFQEVRVQPVLRPTMEVPFTAKPYCHKVKGSFLSQGQVFTAAQTKNSVIIPGEQIEIDLAMANESRNSIKNIQVVLRERVRWSAQRHSKTTFTNLATISLSGNAAPGKSGTNLLVERLQHGTQQERGLNLVAAQLRTGSNLLSVTLPPVPKEARNTYVGVRLSVTHEVIIRLESQKWRRNPEVRLPVRIVAGQSGSDATDSDTTASATMAVEKSSHYLLPIRWDRRSQERGGNKQPQPFLASAA